MTDLSAGDLSAWVRDYVRTVGSDDVLHELTRRIDERILAAIPELAADPALLRVLGDSTLSQWRSYLAHLVQPYVFELPTPADNLARSLARRGSDLGVLLKIYRTVYPTVFDIFTEVTDRLDPEGPPPDQALKFLWTRAQQWLEDSVEALIASYYDERQLLAEGAMIRRSQCVRQVLDDPTTDADSASRDLAHPLSQWQTALVLWNTGIDQRGSPSLLELAARAAKLLDAPRPLTLAVSTHDVWCWIATPTRPDITTLRQLAPGLEEVRAHVAVGTPEVGIAGFRAGHAEATAAQRICLAATGTPPVVEFADVELLCLLSTDDAMVKRMVVREIGPLLTGDKFLEPIRETALVYLSQRQNVEATAEQLFIHKNTVRYRLARAEELLGHPLTANAAKVEIALRYSSVFGPPTTSL